jgi:dTDP-4-dehydrorhamnose reductase
MIVPLAPDWSGRRALVTGAGGTVGRAVAAELGERGAEVIAWDRSRVSPLEVAAVRAHVAAVRPHVLFHLAIASRPTGATDENRRINVDLTVALAKACRDTGVRMVFTSSVMALASPGPYTVHTRPDAAEGYGFEKRRCEEILSGEFPEAVVARIGWQIGDRPGSNNMVDYFATRAEGGAPVAASRRFLPACSMLGDTARSLVRLADAAGGLYLLDANERWTLFDIARALGARHGRWRIEPCDEPALDQRMIDSRPGIPALETRLPDLVLASRTDR